MPPIENAAASVEAMARIAQAVATGDLAPSEAADMAKVVEASLQAVAAHGFDERLTRLEEMAVSKQQPEGRTIYLPSTRS